MGALKCIGASRFLLAGREGVSRFAGLQMLRFRFERSLVSACAAAANIDGECRKGKDWHFGRGIKISSSFGGGLSLCGASMLNQLGARYLGKADGFQRVIPAGTRPWSQLHLGKCHALFSTSAGDVATRGSPGVVEKEVQNSKAEKGFNDEKIADIHILQTLMKNLWLRDNLEFRLRLMLALSLLVGAKVLNVQVPFLFKLAVDWLSEVNGAGVSLASFNESNSMLLALFVSPVAVLIGYGIARTGSSACNELRNAIFSNVALRAIRTVSRKVFAHLLDLDLGYHLSRQTGALNRIIDRGSRAINFVLSSMVFNVVPTILEIAMVSGILAYKFGATFAWITSLSVAAYVAFTLIVTQEPIDKRLAFWLQLEDENNRGTTYDQRESLGFIDRTGREGRYLQDRKILDGVSFVVPAGRSVAIVGTSGSGKSTILRLLFRFFNADSGAILVDGQEIRGVTLDSLRKCIGVVPQDTVLFNDTIFHNIQYGKLSATEEELSGGEKQRVSLARAFLKAPSILLCDEATSSLDSNTEAEILNALKTLSKNRTSIFIAHRLTIAMQCDEIIVLENGKVVQQGPHEYLLSRAGRYAQLWMQQNSTDTSDTAIKVGV
ncbi:hypothetical protein HPP92_001430 [Vanilla planifolia]|uniref:Uncharacterized protein n=1 Tax=Vanilla planifolia TaxID=51239 RepID=A0A835RW88_VANPL|nr:hypothetical protein HPP92_001430 [Vanilla planifolia]